MKLLFNIHAVSTLQSFVENVPDSYELIGEILGVPVRLDSVPPELLQRIDEALRADSPAEEPHQPAHVDESAHIDYALGNVDYDVGVPDE
jgi:hypothetical protein